METIDSNNSVNSNVNGTSDAEDSQPESTSLAGESSTRAEEEEEVQSMMALGARDESMEPGSSRPEINDSSSGNQEATTVTTTTTNSITSRRLYSSSTATTSTCSSAAVKEAALEDLLASVSRFGGSSTSASHAPAASTASNNNSNSHHCATRGLAKNRTTHGAQVEELLTTATTTSAGREAAAITSPSPSDGGNDNGHSSDNNRTRDSREPPAGAVATASTPTNPSESARIIKQDAARAHNNVNLPIQAIASSLRDSDLPAPLPTLVGAPPQPMPERQPGAFRMRGTNYGIAVRDDPDGNRSVDDDVANNNSSQNDTITPSMSVHRDDHSSEHEQQEPTTLVEAVTVEEDLERARIEEEIRQKLHLEQFERQQLEQEIRRQVLQEAIQAAAVPMPEPVLVNNGDEDQSEHRHDAHERGDPERALVPIYKKSADGDNSGNSENQKRMKKYWVAGGIALLLLLLVGALGLGLGLGLHVGDEDENDTSIIVIGNNHNDGESDSILTIAAKSTLDVIRERGYVICGMDTSGFARPSFNNKGNNSTSIDTKLEGFNTEQCRAMALLALGDSTKYKQQRVVASNRFVYLANGTVDLLVEVTTRTIERDVYEDQSHSGFTFTTPYAYVGLKLAGIPEYIDCADRGEGFVGICRGLRICVEQHTSHMDTLADIMPAGVLVALPGADFPYNTAPKFESGVCNVLAAEPPFPSFVEEGIGLGEFKVGNGVLSKEPLALTTRQDDPEWSSLANLMVNAFIWAEANNITAENSNEISRIVAASSRGNGTQADTFSSMLVSLIAEFGHHGDLYLNHMEDYLPRQMNGANVIYDHPLSTGLHYAVPFGTLDAGVSDPMPSGIMGEIVDRGHINCGVLPSRGQVFVQTNSSSVGEPEWYGFDVEVCQGLAAALFVSDRTKIVFVPLSDEVESYKALANGTVDVVAGARLNLEAMFRQPTTEQGYIFSTPFYYDNDSLQAYGFMTRQEKNPQWSDFVFMMMTALIYAEEQGITSATASEMPLTGLFGEELKLAMLDCILAVGSYAELYNRTLQQTIPRAGANQLNPEWAGPQLFPIPLV